MMKKILFTLCACMPLMMCADSDINPSSMVGIIDWSDKYAEKTMEAFINQVQEGYVAFTTLPSKSAQADVRKSALQYHLFLMNPDSYKKYDTAQNRKDYDTVRFYEKYMVMQSLAKKCADSIEEDLEYAYKYDHDNLLGASGVKIAEIAQEIFSKPYSKVVDKMSSDFSDNMIRSSADLAIAQQAAFYTRQIPSLDFQEIYQKVLTGFNSAQISFKEGPKVIH